MSKNKTVLINIDNNSKKDLVRDFNKELKWLMNKIYDVSGKSLRIESLKNKVSIAIGEDVEMIIKEAGSEIYKFKEAIRSNNVEHFCKIDYSKFQSKNKDYDNNLLLMLQEQMPKMNVNDQTEMFKRVNGLLNMYLDFIAFENIGKGKYTPEMISEYGFKYISPSDYKNLKV